MSDSLINKIRRLREFGLMDAEDSEIAIKRICERLEKETKKKKKEIRKKVKNKTSEDIEDIFLKYISIAIH